MPLKIAQTVAFMEILHSAMGIVRSPVMVTSKATSSTELDVLVRSALQVFSRIWILWGIIHPVKYATTTQSINVLTCVFTAFSLLFLLFSLAGRTLKLDLRSMLLAWGMAEIIRYSFYAFKELHLDPYIVKWLRYTGFIVLYPLGVASEMTLVYLAMPFIKASHMWSLQMPNALNFGFSYATFCMLVVAAYLYFFPQLYGYMFGQRKKILGPKNKTD